MKKFVSVLLALMLTVSVAAAEAIPDAETTPNAETTPSVTIPVITKPEIEVVETTDPDGEEVVEKPIVIAPVEAEKDEVSKEFVEKAEEQLSSLAEMKEKQDADEAAGVEVKKNAFIYDYFANAFVTTKAADTAGIKTEKKVETVAVINTINEAGEIVQETKTVVTPAVTLEELATELFGEDTVLLIHEFTPLAIEGYDENVHHAVNVKMKFVSNYTQDKVIAMVGSFDATGTLVWSILVCNVVDGVIEMILDSETLRLINEGKVLVSILSAAV